MDVCGSITLGSLYHPEAEVSCVNDYLHDYYYVFVYTNAKLSCICVNDSSLVWN